MMTTHWQSLDDELARWRDSGRLARVWLRDDDAIEATPALDRLLGLGVPVLIAAIPAHATPGLAQRLAETENTYVAVHGYGHVNHAPKGEKKQELGLHRGADAVLAELARGKARLEQLFAGRLLPILVPPWNRIAPDLVAALPALGFRALSTFTGARFKSNPSLAVIDTHVDLIDWRGTRVGKPLNRLIDELTAALAARREGDSTEPIGVLSHHLVHDDAAWRALDAITERSLVHSCVRWVGIDSLMRTPAIVERSSGAGT